MGPLLHYDYHSRKNFSLCRCGPLLGQPIFSFLIRFFPPPLSQELPFELFLCSRWLNFFLLLEAYFKPALILQMTAAIHMAKTLTLKVANSQIRECHNLIFDKLRLLAFQKIKLEWLIMHLQVFLHQYLLRPPSLPRMPPPRRIFACVL